MHQFWLFLSSCMLTTTKAWLSSVPLRPISSSSTSSMSMSASSTKPLPKLALPPPICSTTPGTWAHDTMSRRVDGEILERTWLDNQATWSQPEFANVRRRFQALRAELQSAATAQLTMLEKLPDDAEEAQQREWNEWQQLLQPHLDKNDTWLSAPWMLTEFYVYRRLMQAIGYFDQKSPGYHYDPFVVQKRAGLHSSVGSAEAMLDKIAALPKTKQGINLAAGVALWGNKMDLSLWPADASQAGVDVFTAILDKATENLLHDDTELLDAHCETLRAKGGGNVDIIVDNAGFELVTDLALAQHLIDSGIAKVVTFQLKSHPTFVSDALEKDLIETVEHYEKLNANQYPNAHAAGQKWRSFLESGQWQCHQDNFWVQPFAMWDMTEPLRSDLAERCDLAFVKGDANYRRLLGDRQWEYTAPFADVVGAYFPCPVCALRTLKAELGCGMDADQVERAKTLDDNWLTNGRFGVVQFGLGAGK